MRVLTVEHIVHLQIISTSVSTLEQAEGLTIRFAADHDGD